jgi:hypothetical protein
MRSAQQPPDGILPASTLSAWQTLAQHLPASLYLAGDTALVVHLRHRESADLRFLYHDRSVDLERLAEQLPRLAAFAVTHTAPGVLRGVFADTNTEFLHADESSPQTLLQTPALIAGLRVAGLKDLMAMKLKDIAERRELRDYLDVMKIDQDAGVSLEDGIPLFMERHRVSPASDTLVRLINALGYLDDVPDDDTLPIGKLELASWWARRQARLVGELTHTR